MFAARSSCPFRLTTDVWLAEATERRRRTIRRPARNAQAGRGDKGRRHPHWPVSSATPVARDCRSATAGNGRARYAWTCTSAHEKTGCPRAGGTADPKSVIDLHGEPYTHQVGLHAGYTWCELSLSNNLSVVGFISPLSGRNIILVTCPFCLARYDEWEARNLPLRA